MEWIKKHIFSKSEKVEIMVEKKEISYIRDFRIFHYSDKAPCEQNGNPIGFEIRTTTGKCFGINIESEKVSTKDMVSHLREIANKLEFEQSGY